MKRLFLVLGILFLARAAGATQLCVMAPYDTEGSAALTSTHADNITTGGDIHDEVTLEQSFEINPSEIFYWHFPYPLSLPDGQNVTLDYTYETTEADPAKMHCLRTTLVGRTNGDVFGVANLNTGALDDILTTPNGSNGLRQWFSPQSTAGTVRRASNLTLPCTHAGCDGGIVRGATRLMTSMPGCTNPSLQLINILKICANW